jgi:dsRNA-specific ribonuclease
MVFFMQTCIKEIFLLDKIYSSAKGHSKKVAQQNAAKEAIDILKKELDL